MQQPPNSGGIPVFIARNQPWGQTAVYANSGSSIANPAGDSVYLTNSSAAVAKSGQSCILPQILQQKEDRLGGVIGTNVAIAPIANTSVLEANRPAPIQAHGKGHDFPEYFNI